MVGLSNRRTFIGSVGSAAALGLAGCSQQFAGDNDINDDGPRKLTLSTHESTSAIYSASQVLSAVVNENQEQIQVEARPSKGPRENVGQLNQSKADMALIENWTWSKMDRGEDPFGNLSFDPLQILNIYTIPWFVVTNNPELTSVDKISADHAVLPGVSGSGAREMVKYSLGKYVDGYRTRDLQYGQQGSAFSEGRLDAGLLTAINYALEPGWVQEVKASDSLGVVSYPDDAKKLRDDPKITITDLDLSDIEGYDLFPKPESVPALTMSFNVISSAAVSYDAVYSLLDTMKKNLDQLGNDHALFTFHQQMEFWVDGVYDGMPFHPAAADFYEEQGVWNDDWERGDVNA